MNAALQFHPTPTQAEALSRRSAFRQKIAARAEALNRPPDIICADGRGWNSAAPPSPPVPTPAPTLSCPHCGRARPIPDGPLMKIKLTVCDRFSVNYADLLSARRTKNIIIPRQVAMYLCKELTPSSLPAIGRAFSDRDHTTVLHAVRKIKLLILSNPNLAATIAKIRADLEALL